MGKFSRDKGARFELQVAGLFREGGYDASRTAQHCGKTGQAADIKNVPYLHIECKSCERMHLYDWVEQSDRDCKNEGKGNIPIVVHKANYRPVLVTMHFEDFIELYREWEAGKSLKGD